MLALFAAQYQDLTHKVYFYVNLPSHCNFHTKTVTTCWGQCLATGVPFSAQLHGPFCTNLPPVPTLDLSPLFFCNQFPKEQPHCSAHHLLSHTAPSILHKGMELLVWVKCLPSGLERSANQYPYGASRTGKLVAAAILHLRRSAVSQGHP